MAIGIEDIPGRTRRIGGVAISGLLCALSVASCARQIEPVRSPDPARAEVLDAVEGYYDDFSARDWDAFASHFWPGATLATVWQPPGADAPRVVVTSVEDFIAQAPLGPGSRAVFEERMTSAEVRVHDDLAHVWARYEARFGDPGDITEWRGIDAFTMMRHDGAWKIVSLSYTNEE